MYLNLWELVNFCVYIISLIMYCRKSDTVFLERERREGEKERDFGTNPV